MVEAYKPLYTVKQAAQILLTNVSAVYELMNTGTITVSESGAEKDTWERFGEIHREVSDGASKR